MLDHSFTSSFISIYSHKSKAGTYRSIVEVRNYIFICVNKLKMEVDQETNEERKPWKGIMKCFKEFVSMKKKVRIWHGDYISAKGKGIVAINSSSEMYYCRETS